MTDLPRSDQELALVATARRVLPGGGFGNLNSEIIIAEGKGGRVRDVSGNEYVDFLLGSGPMFIGHAHPKVVEAVQGLIARGTTFFANNEHGIRLAAAIVDAVPCAEKVRFTSSGTEADSYAMRVARAWRKRDKILKFEGGYHGMGEYSLQSLAPKRPGNFPQASADSPGIPSSVSADMLIAPFNDVEATAALIRQHADEIAGVIVEPFQRLIPPKPGFLRALREMTSEAGIPLIFDEIVTGFRFSYGGAQELYGVTPDLARWGRSLPEAIRWRPSRGGRTSCAISTAGKLGTTSCRRWALCRAIRSPRPPGWRRWRSCGNPASMTVPSPPGGG